MNLSELRATMGGTLPVEVARVMRALAKLDAAVDAMEAAGMKIRIDQKARWTDGGSARHHDGFTVSIDGRFRVENIRVPEPTRSLKAS